MNTIDDIDFPGGLYKHCAVCLGHCVVVLGGIGETRVDAPEPFRSAIAAATNGTIYTFGGVDQSVRNALWTLTRTGECFTWTFLKPKCDKESPSPKTAHTGWEYTGNLWTFGGTGPSQWGYLNDHGDFASTRNNQLLCFDTNSDKWINPQCYGNVPSPRWGHASAIIKNKVWIIGGFESTHRADDDMFELSMHSLTWSQIQTGKVR